MSLYFSGLTYDIVETELRERHKRADLDRQIRAATNHQKSRRRRLDLKFPRFGFSNRTEAGIAPLA